MFHNTKPWNFETNWFCIITTKIAGFTKHFLNKLICYIFSINYLLLIGFALFSFFLSVCLQKDDTSLLAQFFFADEALNMIASELDSFDGRKDPERCTSLVNQLRQSQDKVLNIIGAIMDDLIGDERANRDFRVKFPEDVLQENLAGQLWFGAEVTNFY